jgi:hypothetical protein
MFPLSSLSGIQKPGTPAGFNWTPVQLLPFKYWGLFYISSVLKLFLSTVRKIVINVDWP